MLREFSVFAAPSSGLLLLLVVGSTFIGGSAAIGAFGSAGSGGFGGAVGCFLGSSVFTCVLLILLAFIRKKLVFLTRDIVFV